MNNILAINLENPIIYIIPGILVLLIMLGIFLMSKVKHAKIGNFLSAFAVLAAVIATLVVNEIVSVWLIYVYLFIGALIGIWLALKVKMINMPQLIALLNGLGGLASLIVGGYALFSIGTDNSQFSFITAIIALLIGGITFTGSLIAAGKLHRLLKQKPTFIKGNLYFLLAGVLLLIAGLTIYFIKPYNLWILLAGLVVLSFLYGILFTLRIGGADMPIVISLLNSLSGVAGAISGLAIADLMLVSVGGIVGASGLLLTQIMCKAMNRSLFEIILGKTTTRTESENEEEVVIKKQTDQDYKEVVLKAKEVIIVPGYGMAVAQAQHLVKDLRDLLVKKGIRVRFAIHPVAGRMPGHMNVLLAEANIDYDELFEMDELNDDFKNTDIAIIVGANDVINPAARDQENTPIYQMPILNADYAKNIFIFNYDLKPGYSGVNNPIYQQEKGVYFFLGNAFNTLDNFINEIKSLK